MPISRLLLVLEVWDGKPTYLKSWAGNLLVRSDLTLGPSFKVKRGQPNLKVLITRLLLVLEVWDDKPAYRKSWAEVLITRLLLVLEVWDGKPAYRKSWAGNLLVWSDLPPSRSNEDSQN